jgi:hypothetical protein
LLFVDSIECIRVFIIGLGGIGGPYRLDSGHQVYQVPDDVKAAVPDHIRQAARELGKKVFNERLKEIEMSEYEHDAYEKYFTKISSEIRMLRAIIESLEAKSHDRQWVVRHTDKLQYRELADKHFVVCFVFYCHVATSYERRLGRTKTHRRYYRREIDL